MTTDRGPGVQLIRCRPSDEDWRHLDALPGRTLFQKRAWVQFVAESQGAEPVVARVVREGSTVAWFTGLIVRRLGVRILGSPFPGWTTAAMGFTFLEDVRARDAVRALRLFAFRELHCAQMEFSDPAITVEDVAGLGLESELGLTYRLGLGSDDEIFGCYTSACRRAVRKAEKSGVVVEDASEDPLFAEEYHDQLVGVFARQGLAPTYGVERVRALVEHVGPTGRLLLLRARGPEGESLATGIYPADDVNAYFWGGASRKEAQILRPNEALFWHAMRSWRDRGVTTFDFGGGGDYKRRFGGQEFWSPSFRCSRYVGLPTLRRAAQLLVARRQRLPAAQVPAHAR